jgi:hypothetical protein
LRFALRALTGRIRLHRFSVVTHHFMSADELDTPNGRERIDGELRSMCEVNGAGAHISDEQTDVPKTEILDPVA